MFDGVSVEETRSVCRGALDALEFWLRRVADQILSYKFGQDYFDYQYRENVYLIKKTIRESAKKRIQSNGGRYRRPIDAISLEDVIAIITNPDIYPFFRDVFQEKYPEGVYELKTFLTRLIEPRNALAHANPISTRDAERIVCYSHDCIDSIKDYYRRKGMGQEYNVPVILRITDSFGNVIDHKDINAISGHIIRYFTDEKKYDLHPGDTISLEVEIDPSFPEKDYIVVWHISAAGFDEITGKKLEIKIENRHVKKLFLIECSVRSNKDWHAHGHYDDVATVGYKVLPPEN